MNPYHANSLHLQLFHHTEFQSHFFTKQLINIFFLQHTLITTRKEKQYLNYPILFRILILFKKIQPDINIRLHERYKNIRSNQ